jgi:hypothetical protein
MPGAKPEQAVLGLYEYLMQVELTKGPSNNEPWGYAYEFII